MFGISKKEKTYITRYITLNYPCNMSDLVRELCFSDDGPLIGIANLFKYLKWAEKNKHIRTEPSILSTMTLEMFKHHTIYDLLKENCQIKIIIPDFVSDVWIKYCNKSKI